MTASAFARPAVTLTTIALLMFAYGPPAGAQATQSLYSPVIIVYDGLHRYAGADTARGWLQMREDGSALAQFASGGNLSYVGGAGGRYFLFGQESSEITLPDGSRYVDCVAWHENGDPSTRRVLTSDHSLLRQDCQWSADGNHVTFGGKRIGSAGDVVESGAFLGDIEWLGGEPVRIYNERLIASDQPSVYRHLTGFGIDATGQRGKLRWVGATTGHDPTPNTDGTLGPVSASQQVTVPLTAMLLTPRSPRQGFDHPVPSEITPRAAYEGRREFLKQLAAGSAGAAVAAWAGRDALAQAARPGKLAALPGARSAVAGAMTLDKPTAYADATSYNNYYEFGTGKDDPAARARTLQPRPWTVAVEGAVAKPQTFGLDDLLKLSPMEGWCRRP